MKINIKPMSVNDCWQGQRFKTKAYKQFEHDMGILLKKGYKVPQNAKLSVSYRFGFSSVASDIDNPVKPLQDILQKMYGFNDKMIYRMVVEKEIVPKGSEYLEFEFEVMHSIPSVDAMSTVL